MRRLALTLVAVLILADSGNLLGVAQGGPRRGERLPAIPHVDALWFAWAAFHPAMSVHTE